MAIDQYVARGLSRAEAEAAARRDFGRIDRVKERHREVRGLARRPSFTIAVFLTLGLGIGATTTVYSVVDGIILRPLPYDDPAALVVIGDISSTDAPVAGDEGLRTLAPISMPTFTDVRLRARSFEALAVIERTEYPLADVGEGPELLPSARISADFLPMIGVSPALGRSFLGDEFSVIGPPVVMLSYGAWQRMYGGDPDVVGQVIERSLTPATIIGVLPEDFTPPEVYFRADEQPELWFPLLGDHDRYQRRNSANLLVLGRLRRGATLEDSRSELAAIAGDLAREYATESVRSDGAPLQIGAKSLHTATVGSVGRTLWLFLGAAGLLLTLAALNSAMLFSARTMDRRSELGIRAALGASRIRVVSILAAETLVLSAAGGLLGVAIAYNAVAAFRAYAPESIPRLSSVAVDVRVLVVAAAVSLGAGIIAGLLPALRLTRRGEWGRLQGVNRSAGVAPTTIPRIMVGSQAAAAVVLLSCAALLFGSFVRLRSVDPGFEPGGLITMRLDVEGFARSAPGRFTSVHAAWDLAMQELAAVPGVDAVAVTSDVPYRSPSWSPRLLLPGDQPNSWREGIAGYAITPDYLRTMGTELLRGRFLEVADGPDAEPVAVVNASFVRTQLQGADPLDLVLMSTDGPDPSPIRIVGVVEDVVQRRPEDGPRPAMYVPYTQQVSGQPYAVVRTSRPPDAIVPELRRAAARFNPIIPLREVSTMTDRMAVTQAMPRFQAILIGAFAFVALLLAAAGLYGSLAHWVARRKGELAVRLALGAGRAQVLRMVLRQGMMVSLTGLGVGLLAALLLTRTLARTLYDLEPHDPRTLAAVAVTFILVSALACLAPAHRATRVHPATVLRQE